MKIALLGDIALFGKFCLNKNFDYKNYFLSVRIYLNEFDIVIANLEAPFVVDEYPIIGKSATLKAHPYSIEILKYLGVTHVTLANNHIGDFGSQAYVRTKKMLDDADIGWFGTEGKQIEIERYKEKVALLGYCSYNTNPSPLNLKNGSGLNYVDVELIIEKMQLNKEKGFFNIIAIHSGQEHVHLPSSDDVLFARGLSKNFDYVYYGHHPHVIQAMEKSNKSSIFYSLGNFIFYDVFTEINKEIPLIKLSEANKTGGIGVVEISDGNIINSKLVPIYLADDKMLVDNDVPELNIISINNELNDVFTAFYENRRKILIYNYIKRRIDMRNFEWYLKRINLNSVGIILRAKLNSYLYKRNYKNKLKLLED
jgi:hypothetical protein